MLLLTKKKTKMMQIVMMNIKTVIYDIFVSYLL